MFPDDICLHLVYDKITDELCCHIPEDIISRTQESRDDIWNIGFLHGSLGIPFVTLDERDYLEMVVAPTPDTDQIEERFRLNLNTHENNIAPTLTMYTQRARDKVTESIWWTSKLELAMDPVRNRFNVTVRDPRVTLELSEKTKRHFSPRLTTVSFTPAQEKVAFRFDGMAGFRRIFIVCKYIAPHVFHNGLNLGVMSSNVTHNPKHFDFIEFPPSPGYFRLNKNFPLENFSVYMVDEFGKKLNLSASHCYCMLHLQRVQV
jgi:hypothetical protein